MLLLPNIRIIAGPPGGGKNHMKGLLKQQDPLLIETCSDTTRERLDRDVEGDYSYITAAEMQRKITAGEMLEAMPTHGVWYGTPKAEIERVVGSGMKPLLELDLKGIRAVGELLIAEGQGKRVYAAFLTVSLAMVRQSIIDRYNKSRPDQPIGEPHDLDVRMSTAEWEQDEARKMEGEDPAKTGFVLQRFPNQLRTPESTARLLGCLENFYKKADD